MQCSLRQGWHHHHQLVTSICRDRVAWLPSSHLSDTTNVFTIYYYSLCGSHASWLVTTCCPIVHFIRFLVVYNQLDSSPHLGCLKSVAGWTQPTIASCATCGCHRWFIWMLFLFQLDASKWHSRTSSAVQQPLRRYMTDLPCGHKGCSDRLVWLPSSRRWDTTCVFTISYYRLPESHATWLFTTCCPISYLIRFFVFYHQLRNSLPRLPTAWMVVISCRVNPTHNHIMAMHLLFKTSCPRTHPIHILVVHNQLSKNSSHSHLGRSQPVTQYCSSSASWLFTTSYAFAFRGHPPS